MFNLYVCILYTFTYYDMYVYRFLQIITDCYLLALKINSQFCEKMYLCFS